MELDLQLDRTELEALRLVSMLNWLPLEIFSLLRGLYDHLYVDNRWCEVVPCSAHDLVGTVVAHDRPTSPWALRLTASWIDEYLRISDISTAQLTLLDVAGKLFLRDVLADPRAVHSVCFVQKRSFSLVLPSLELRWITRAVSRCRCHVVSSQLETHHLVLTPHGHWWIRGVGGPFMLKPEFTPPPVPPMISSKRWKSVCSRIQADLDLFVPSTPCCRILPPAFRATNDLLADRRAYVDPDPADPPLLSRLP